MTSVHGASVNVATSVASPPKALAATLGGNGLLNRMRTSGLPATGNDATPPNEQGGKITWNNGKGGKKTGNTVSKKKNVLWSSVGRRATVIVRSGVTAASFGRRTGFSHAGSMARCAISRCHVLRSSAT